MKLRVFVPCFLMLFILYGCKKEEVSYPFVGTYILEVNDDTRHAYASVKASNMQWPELTLYNNGTYIMVNPEGTRKGVFRWENEKLILICKMLNFENATGRDQQPRTYHFEGNYQVLVIEGTKKDRWIRKFEQ